MQNLRDIIFVECPLHDCIQAAEKAAANGDNWHNHVLKPRCGLNPYPGKYVLIIENNSSGDTLAHISGENPAEAARHIVRLRHGADVVSSNGEQPLPAHQPAILTRIRELVGAGADWHHHMMLPDCVFNPNPGQWLITLESELGEETVEYSSDDEPIEVLRAIETLFFDQELGK